MKKDQLISYFLLVVFTLMYSHQFVPHHKHISQESVELSNCSHHKIVECSTSLVSSFSHFISHVFNCDLHIDNQNKTVVTETKKVTQHLKTLFAKTSFTLNKKTNLKLVFRPIQDIIFVSLFHTESFSYRGPPVPILS